MCAGAEYAMHLTGRYPSWWEGRVWDRPIVGWAAGVTSETTRDTLQRMLLGRINAIGTGMIPRDAIKDSSPRRGVADAVDSVVVAHGGGGDVQAGESLLFLKAYDQGREKFQGETLDLGWCDEEPPLDVYTEFLTRTNAPERGVFGSMMMTFTPLLGMSDVVARFVMEKALGTIDINMTIDDVDHYTPEQKAQIIASYPAHEREARARGIPVLGSGRIFPIEEALVEEEAIQIPPHWPRLAALDFGWDHPTAGVWGAWDRDNDVVHIYDCYRVREQPVPIHASAVKAKGAWIPVAWPHDGNNDTAAGPQLAQQYRGEGVNMLPHHAQYVPTSHDKKDDDAKSNRMSVEAGVQDMLTRMMTGRLKVAKHLNDWWEEFRLYHREDGKIVKVRDDLMCLHPDTVVVTDSGGVRIGDLVGTAGMVLSIHGQWAAFRSCRMTRENAEMVRVEYSDGTHLVCTPDHLLLDAAGRWVRADQSVGMCCHVARGDRQWKRSGSTASDSLASATTGDQRGNSCIAPSGRKPTAGFLPATTFTTKMVIARTTSWQTWRWLRGASIFRRITKDTSDGLMPPLLPLLSGERPRLANPSCLSWVGAMPYTSEFAANSFATAAASHLRPKKPEPIGSAQQTAGQRPAAGLVLTTWFDRVRTAALSSRRIGTAARNVAALVVDAASGFRRQQAPRTLRVLRVERAPRSDAYCMEVDGLHAFAIANGSVVHNCATRYLIMSLENAITAPIQTNFLRTRKPPNWRT